MDNGRIKIILADDHTLFRDGLKRLLSLDERFEVVGEAASGTELLEKMGITGRPETALPKTTHPASAARNDATVTPMRPDVVFMDIDMPGMNGIEASRRLLEADPDARIITLSMHGDQEYYFAMVESGVKGFLLKNSTFDEVAAAAVSVAAGGTYFSQELLGSLVTALRHSDESHGEALSRREVEVLPLICEGLANKQIADKLFISKRTVDKHRANILSKTGCKNTASLVVYAVKHNLIEI